MTYCDTTGKIKYASKRAVRIALRRHTGSFATLHSYRCRACFGFHIGHRDPKGKYAWR